MNGNLLLEFSAASLAERLAQGSFVHADLDYGLAAACFNVLGPRLMLNYMRERNLLAAFVSLYSAL